MTKHLGTTSICVSLLMLISSAALGQSYPATRDSYPATRDVGSPGYRVAINNPEAPANQGLELNGAVPAIRRLPPLDNTQPPTYVASALLGGTYPARAGTGIKGTGIKTGSKFIPKAEAVSDTCDRCSKSECECAPRWIMSADLLWMSRSRANSQTMIESPAGGGSESFNARELRFDARAGFRTSWGYDLMDGRAVELSAFSVYDQPATANVGDANMFFTFHNLPAAIPTDAYTINYVSNLHNGELNWWLDEAWGIRPMLGARWIRVREEFSILDTTDTSWDAFSEMQNDLVGAQLGFKTRLWGDGNRLRVEVAMKSGVYHNNVDYQARIVDAGGASQGSISRSPSATSFAGELTVTAVMQFTPHVAMRCGYHGLWMTEIGLAPNQANRSDIATGIGTDHLGALNYQGGFIGLEANW